MDPYNPFYALIVAGGSGTRMASSMPKQFLDLAGMPMIVRTLSPFVSMKEISGIILVLPKEYLPMGKDLINQHFSGKNIEFAAGGDSRTLSVSNGLDLLPHDGIVAIHDGARPLVTQALIRRSFATAMEYGAAVPIVHVRDTVRKFTGETSEVIDREMLRLVQTPQTFSLRIIRDAYKRAGGESFTDDAAVIAEAGYRFTFIDGESTNIKVTTPEDMEFATAVIATRNN